METVLIFVLILAVAVLTGAQLHHARQLEELAIAYDDLERDYHELRNDAEANRKPVTIALDGPSHKTTDVEAALDFLTGKKEADRDLA